jgi:hypothetical protein
MPRNPESPANQAIRGMRGQRAERRMQMLYRVFDKPGQEPDPLDNLQKEAAEARAAADRARREAERTKQP